jgi:hypothetical protein
MRYLLSAYREDDYVQLVKAMLEKEDTNVPGTACRLNNDGESPILYYEQTKAEFEQREERKAARKKKIEADREAKAARTGDGQVSQSQKPITQPVPAGDPSDAELERAAAKRNLADKRRPDLPDTRLAMERPQLFEKTLQKSYTMGRTGQEGADTSQPGKLMTPVSASGLSYESQAGSHHPARQPKTAGKTGESGSIRRGNDPEVQRPRGVQQPNSRNDSGKALLNLFVRHYLRTRTDLEARSLIYGRNKSGKSSPSRVALCGSDLTLPQSSTFPSMPRVTTRPPTLSS